MFSKLIMLFGLGEVSSNTNVGLS